MKKFQGVDIISTLRKIVNNNNLHYSTDFDYDIDTLKAAAVGDRFVWLSRYSGTWLANERDVHIRNTYAYNTWQYYTDINHYGVKAFALEVTSNENGKPIGDIFQLDYNKHREEVRKNSFNAMTVDVTFKPPHWDKTATSITRTFDVVEYEDNLRAIVNRYGQVEQTQYNLCFMDERQLTSILENFKARYQSQTSPANINDFVREMVRERFHEYGYKQDDMVFTTPTDAHTAVKYKIPVYVLHPSNIATLAKDTQTVDNALFEMRLFGMDAQSKKILNFLKAGNTFNDLPFTREELKTIFALALEKGKGNFTNKEERENIDKIIRTLDATLFAIDTHDEIVYEQEPAHDDECEGYEP